VFLFLIAVGSTSSKCIEHTLLIYRDDHGAVIAQAKRLIGFHAAADQGKDGALR